MPNQSRIIRSLLKIIFISLFTLSGCAGPSNQTSMPVTTDNQVTAISPTIELGMTITPSPEPPITLPVAEILFVDRLSDNGDDTYSVNFPSEEFDSAHPPMVYYIWQINPNVDADLEQVVVQFTISHTAAEDIPGYERGFFPWLHNLSTININSPVPESTDLTMDRNTILRYPEFGELLDRYITVENGTYMLAIPYEQFLGGRTSLVLGFLPGTTFSMPEVSVAGSEIFAESILDELGVEQSIPMYNVEPVVRQFWDGSFEVTNDFARFNGWIKNEWSPLFENAYQNGIFYMPVSDYLDVLGSYAEEIDGTYAVIPDGLPLALHVINDSYSKTFLMAHMVDPETGLIHGIWDIEQNQLVASDRTVANLPIAASYFQNDPGFAYQLLSAVAQYEVIDVDGHWIYAPRGINANQEITVRLADLAMNEDAFQMITDTKDPEIRVKLLEAYANTLGLILEVQEQSNTNLPPSEFIVKFESNNTHSIRKVEGPLGDFNINDPFYTFSSSMQEVATDMVLNHIGPQLSGVDNEFNRAWSLATDPEQQTVVLANAKRIIDEADSSFKILYYNYRIFYHIYTFQRQDGLFAARYDIDSGNTLLGENTGGAWNGFSSYYGGPGSAINWMMISGFFHDDAMLTECYKLAEASIKIFNDNVSSISEVDPAEVLSAMRQNELGIFTDGAILTWVMTRNDLGVYVRSGVPPWQLGGSLIWMMTPEEYYQWKLAVHEISSP
jgi:hypothetical protein